MAGIFGGAAPQAIAAVLLAGSLGACATAAQREYQAIKSNNHAASQQLKACITEAYNNQIAAPLWKHLPQNVDDATIEQLADNSTVTRDEIAALEATYPRFQECRKAALEQISSATPTLIPILLTEYNKMEDEAVKLAKRQVSWAEYLRNLRQIKADTLAQIKAEDVRLTTTLRQEHQAELNRRQAAASAAALAASQYQPPPAWQYHPSVTCMSMGPMMAVCQ